MSGYLLFHVVFRWTTNATLKSGANHENALLFVKLILQPQTHPGSKEGGQKRGVEECEVEGTEKRTKGSR